MFSRATVYTVHENPDVEEPSDRVLVVREGFSMWAFLFTFLWSLYHRLWLLSALYLTLTFLLLKSGQAVELGETARGIVQLGLQVWFGFAAHDWQREALTRRGYTEKSVVIATTPLLAEQRYYDHQAA